MATKEKKIVYIDKITEFCILGLVFILPFVNTITIRETFIFVPVILWIYKMALKREVLFVKNQMTAPVAIFLFFAVLSLFGAVDLKYSTRELFDKTFGGFLLFFLLLNYVDDMAQVNRIILSLFLGSLVQGVYSTIHFFAMHKSLLDYNSFESGFASDHKYYSTFLIMVIPFILFKVMTSRGKIRLAFIGLLTLNLFTLLASQQRGAWLAVAVQVLIFCWYAKRKALLLIVGIGALAFVLLPSGVIYHGKKGIDLKTTVEHTNTENSINPRIGIWKFSLKEIASHPFTPIGIGRRNFYKKYTQFKDSETWHAHNTLLNLALELGVQGALAFTFMVYVLARTFWIGLKKTSGVAHYWFLASLVFLIGFLVRNMFDDLYVDDLAQMFWVLSGLSVAVFLKIENIPYDRMFPSAERLREKES